MFHGLLGSYRWTVNLVFYRGQSYRGTMTPPSFFFFFSLSIDETLLLLIMRKKLLLNTHTAFLPTTRHLNRRRESNSSPLTMHVLSCLCIAEHKIWWHLSLRFHASILISGTSDRRHVITVASLTHCFKLVKRDTNQIKLLLIFIYIYILEKKLTLPIA
jgi:hypothetical protein